MFKYLTLLLCGRVSENEYGEERYKIMRGGGDVISRKEKKFK
jgi:hypothetical protein